MSIDIHKFEIEERRRQVGKLVARGLSQREMAQALGVDQSTISLDVKALKRLSQKFVYELARSDLPFFYKSCIDNISDAKSEAWRIFSNSQDLLSTKDRIALMQLIVSANVELFKIISAGPSILSFNVLEQRLRDVEATATTAIAQQTV